MCRTSPSSSTLPLTYNGRGSRAVILSAVPLLASLALVAGCGGDSGGQKPPDQQGPFVQIAGAQRTTFSLAPEDVDVKCLFKRSFEELEYEGQDPASGNGLRLVIKDYKPGAMALEYGIDKPQHVVDLTLGGGFKYRFFQHLRSDQDEVYNTRCDLTTEEQEAGATTRYSGHINCTLLFADASSPDYAGTDQLNAFVDLVARFECER